MLSTSETKTTYSWILDLVFLAALLGIFYALWIGGHALFTPDEGRYSEVAREMVASGDFITPRVDGVAFLDKPILYYWLQASAIKLFGLKEWALRFWPALMGVLGCLMTYFAGQRLYNRRTGMLSALILATSPLYYGAAHYANLDLEVAALIGITLLFSLLALQSQDRKQQHILFLCAYVFCGLAALTKGLIGLVFPMMIIGLWILILNRWGILKYMRLISGLIIFAVITVPWYYLVQQANPEFLHYFFVTQQVSRFLTQGEFNNQSPHWFYLPIVLGGFFPWSVFAFQAIGKNLCQVWRNRQQHATELFLLLWLILIFIFFSIPQSKTVGYIIPIFPALALMVGNYLDGLWTSTRTKGFKSGAIAFSLITLIAFVGCLVAPHIKNFHVTADVTPYLTMASILFISASVGTFYLIKKDAYTTLVSGLVISAAALLLVLSASTGAINQKSIKPIAQQILPKLTNNDEVVAYYKYFQDLPIYLQRRITIVADWTATDIPKKDNWVRELWYGMPFQDTKSWLIDEATFWQRWNSNKQMFVVMSNNSYQEFRNKAQNSIQEMGMYNDVVWVSNH